MFRTSVPATADSFHDRETELSRGLQLVEGLLAGTPSWLAIIGPRKIGKTSLVMELARRADRASLLFVVLDAQEVAPPSPEFFRTYALRALDQTIGRQLGESLEILSRRPDEFRRAIQGSAKFGQLSPTLRAEILELPGREVDGPFARVCLDLPERLAQVLGLWIVVAIDEFQELASVAAPRRAFEPYPLMRSVWQRHERTSYIVSGSARSMLTELLTAEHSPFFQHFSILDLAPFSVEDSVSLLVGGSPGDCQIPEEIAKRSAALLGGHPFYLQLLGEALVSLGPPVNEESFKSAVQGLLFSRTGRVALYFENEYRRLVGRSSYLAAVLLAVSEGPLRMSAISKVIGAASGAAAGYLERLGDAVIRREDGLYELSDPTFGLWLRWRRPGGSALPMTLVGDEAERSVAEHLSRMGFELVYQSRASRGAFDLLGLRGSVQLGIQVKRTQLPARFSRGEWDRMKADGKRFGWQWVIAAVSREGEVLVLDPGKARRGQEVRLTQAAAIDNLLEWIG